MLASKTVGIVSLATLCLVALAVVYLFGSQCSGERWSVKTLSDRDRSRVSLEAVFATVEQLRGLAPPPDPPPDRRAPPVELTTYVVKARVVGIEKMWDRDFHLVISAPHDRSLTMITEFVDPDCAGVAHSPEVLRFKEARQAFVSLFGVPSRYFTAEDAGQMVEVTGIGFFDRVHGETGQAPNGIELHPVLGLRLVD